MKYSWVNLEFARETKKADGKILYVVTLDFDGELNDSNATTFQQYVMPVAEDILGKEDIFVVLYYSLFNIHHSLSPTGFFNE